MHYRHTLVLAAAAISVAFAMNARANPAHERLSSMSEQERRSALAAFLVKSGEKCPVVTKTFYQGSDKKGSAMWNAACTGGGSFVIQVNNDSKGSTRILNCNVLKAVNGGACFTKFKS